MFQSIRDESLQKIIKNQYFGILGQIIVLFGMGFVLMGQISNEIFLIGLVIHAVLILSRLFFVSRYKHNQNKSTFIMLYSISSVFSGIAWGSLLFVIQDLPIQNHFMIYVILISMVFVALFILSEVLFIYMAYVIPILLISSTWFFIQETNKLYEITFYFSIAIIVYFYVSAKKYNKRYLDVLDEKEKSNKLLSELKEKSNSFETLFEESINGTLIIENGVFIQCNQKSVDMMGYNSKEELLNTNFGKMSPKYQLDGELSSQKASRMIKLVMKNGYHSFEWMHLKVDKTMFLANVKLSLISLNAKEVIYTSWQDITEEKKLQDSLNRQANYDSLTSLPNRILFHDRLTQGILKAKRKNTKLALLFLDIDNFKQINDSFGHETGDDVLKYFSKLLKCQIRSEDTLARLGGDEFTIILENINTADDVSLLAQKIVNTMVEPIVINGNSLSISASIGISMYPQDSTEEKNLLKYADIAMYKAKENGRNNFQFYSLKMIDIATERLDMENSLRSAIINNEFIIYYQPKIDVKSSEIIGLEALVRWQHPTIGFVLPDKFIPIAKKLGLIADIDKIVRKMAMVQVTCWYEAGLNPGSLSLNLSTKQLDKENLIIDMKDVGFKSKWLELEVSENDIMNNPKKYIKKLIEIDDLGIKIVIDDFGTGYSSLPYLKRLPITKLKIDQSLIKDIPNAQEDKDIVKVIIALSKSLNIDIIAKGVETVQQRDFLVENGCSNIQGYYYSKPLPVKDIEELIKIGKIDVR
ncbi:MAG: EAL domain-containing protein [Sulfurimonas sp.]|nr:EAL domain-containing protein [Sulfurimonas sp.]